MATSLEQSPYFAGRLQRGEAVVRDLPKFDLDSYIANYEGQSRLTRLRYIALLCPQLSLEALHLAIPEALNSKNPAIYEDLTALLHEFDPEDALAIPDVEWIERRKKENQRESERLEQELRGYKNNLIKESIRMGQEDLASHFLATADFENAQKAFQKMREYCTTPKHVAEMTIKLMYASLISASWLMVQSHCHKARVLSFKPEDKAKFDPAIEACSGLASLGIEEYGNAAKAFLRVNPSYMTAEPISNIIFQKQVMTGNDVAVYGGLTALASMDREQLRTQVLENTEFRTFLELEPHIRRAISNFCEAKYTACLEALEAYRSDYLLDIYLGPRLNDLYGKIRSKSIIQYFVPFSHVRIADLATAFPLKGQGAPSGPAAARAMEDELVEMIQSGMLEARIDAVDGLLLAPPQDTRSETQEGVLETAAEVEHSLRLKLHRLNMQHAGLELANPKGGKGMKMTSGAWDGPELGTPMSNA
ncbi:COP9 signalosome complex subunit 1-like protein [Elsinoe fawcettii]|nr:COP9 signalosome complex subunit 1-like protein [Elsinoe fawcettii]